ncbi:cation:proton antiporter [Paenibacillus macerans]|uniref:Sodium/hydrogen exchanger family protein n=1 Tax=Paenibacillus macerans TaxID=44252 RepID=A0A090ZJF2_PAEMA|nr:cation:proton antiporter [Paenibacillus macerans]KFN10518.1 sodium/hydrogen exchanger family protein [Paenibacillus macerans]MCY7557058.1 cation:proton antiporter [Paenibacillus macerans]MEC0141403.1 cation:proton antiporter [Paenibacillus macerans]MEC0151651.1 cation:proton antiporter [Paenibacillus macerans]UMV47683.1 cation:proton antiporter [Paenibacillus macerans]
MESAVTEAIHHFLILILFVISVGVVSGKLAAWLRLPDVAVFIAVGMLLGPGLGLIHEQSGSLINQLILTVGSALILFDGGRNLRLSGLRNVWITLSLLSVPGVVISTIVMGVGVHYLFGVDWIFAFLAAAVIASTDPASIIPVFKQVKIKERVRETVESESAFNDATGSILTFSLLAAVAGGGALDVGAMSWEFVKTALGGILAGLIISGILTYLAGHARHGYFRDYSTIVMTVCALSSYLIADLLHVSGFMATFVAGVIWGNAETFGLSLKDNHVEMSSFAENMTVMMRMLIFVLLGSQVNFATLGQFFWPSLAAVLILMFVARPLSVLLCAWPDRKVKWTWRELLFMCWVRETGVIPAALSGMIAGMGIAHSNVITGLAFMAIVLTIIIQASTTGWVAKKLGLEVKETATGKP